MSEKQEVDAFWGYISRSIDRILACLDGLPEDALNWRPLETANGLYVLAAHVLGTTEENILGVLCGQPVQRQRDAEFAARGVSAEPLRSRWSELRLRIQHGLEQLPPGELVRRREHPRRGPLTGQEVLIVVARHAAEHMGQAELTRDLLLKPQPGSRAMPKLGPDDRPGYKNVEVVDGYDRWAGTYDREPNPLIMLEESVTLELIGDVRGRRVLDLGCGTGRYCVLLAERGAAVVGLDPSPGMLEQAGRKITAACPFELRQGTLAEAGFPNASFDLVVSALTLGHIPELEPALREAVRVLKSGGTIVISDIHPYWPLSGHAYAEFLDETGQEYRIPEVSHLVEEYWRLFSKLGMRLEEIREPEIDGRLLERFPFLQECRGIPLAIVLKARKLPLVSDEPPAAREPAPAEAPDAGRAPGVDRRLSAHVPPG